MDDEPQSHSHSRSHNRKDMAEDEAVDNNSDTLEPPPLEPAATRAATTAMVRTAAEAPASASASAATPSTTASRRKAPKPNRQRCKEFRERRKQHVGGLAEKVDALRHEVSELVTTKSIYTSKMLLKRHHPHGSLEKLVREYFTVFRYGVPVERPLSTATTTGTTEVSTLATRSTAHTRAQTQRAFLQRVVDPESVYGDHKGPAGAFIQWSYFTAAYASFVGEVDRVHICGSEEDPLLYCYTTYHVIISRNTVKFLFPHAVSNEALVQRLIGLYMACPVVGLFQFTENSHILSATADIALAEALLGAGCRVEDVAELMSGFVGKEDGHVPDRLQAEEYQELKSGNESLFVDDEHGTNNTNNHEEDKDDEGKDDAQAKEKLRISFLLDEASSADSEEKENEARLSN